MSLGVLQLQNRLAIEKIMARKKEIESRSKSPKSLMPEDLVKTMTEDDLVDAVEYLFSLKTPALALDHWHVAGPFDNGAGDAGIDHRAQAG